MRHEHESGTMTNLNPYGQQNSHASDPEQLLHSLNPPSKYITMFYIFGQVE